MMKRDVTLVASLHPQSSLHDLGSFSFGRSSTYLEIRGDLGREMDTDWLRGNLHGDLLYSLRSRAEGGACEHSPAIRRERFIRAARHYDLIELEGERDLHSDVLEAVPPSKRVISWRGSTNCRDLIAKVQYLSATPARYYKIVTVPAHPGDEVAPLAMLAALRRTDTVAFAEGDSYWTRLVAPSLGAPLIFADTANGGKNVPTVSQLRQDYGFPSLPVIRNLFGIVGANTARSLSPRLHNAAFRALGRPSLFVSLPAADFHEFWTKLVQSADFAALGLNLKALTVTSPFKTCALQVADEQSEMVGYTRSTNLFLKLGTRWRAETTEAEGVLPVLKEHRITIAGKTAAVVGCGGSGRVVAAALARAGANVTLVNRSVEHGEFASALLGLPFVPLSKFSVRGFSLVVNATPVGRDGNQIPFLLHDLDGDAVIVDQVYGERPTPLVQRAEAMGRRVIDGFDVLLGQVRQQFLRMNGEPMPSEAICEAVGPQLANRASRRAAAPC